ncbi:MULTISPECIES: class I SAM-dependent methyltransferase [Shouchella]|uniref:Class I SAM-dependent methyltransferase n=2 Tax=Shouchella TaxID=2893057 RepID=A0ABY7W713_9BACI|nr:MULTISPECIES: class I SAM-dependent methyltransferase [Shouchella]MED4130045.1 class I SAM-dependent methyltransferase [Shouchella miscanthi]WDF04224.1 class I SAM-dependent methyltransferase [Shouchella hunanensis]GAF21263.1 adenine-specific methyltransferase [Bacillus sp. JCM 19047]
MEQTNVTALYEYLDESAKVLEQVLDVTYLDALAEAGDNLFEKAIIQELASERKEQLLQLMEPVNSITFTKEDVRKAFQLAVMKGMKGTVQPNHSMTPDAVSLFMSYLANKLQGTDSTGDVLDLAVGSGNLLFSICNHAEGRIGQAYGFEVDETLLKNAFASANLQKHEIQLFHQDSLHVNMPDVHLVVADLPVGYYPKDDIATNYDLKAESGHSYIHHLMIEQGIRALQPGGFGLLLVPNFIFESDQADKLHAFLKEHAVVLGLLQLPASMFSNKQQQKSILMIQKKAEKMKKPQQALLAELPSFSNVSAMQEMMSSINKWFKEQLGR